jgi:hypothetical protein
MEYATMKTLTGMTIADLRTALDQPFDPEAYKSIPGADYLTDIDPAYMKKCLNDVFGICGLGWGYAYNPSDMVIEAGSRTDGIGAFLKAGTVWFKLVADGDQEHTITIQASGGSENKRVEFALKGALTNMIGNAVSQIGFQESVYMGKRSHRTENGNPRKPPEDTAAQPAAKTHPASFLIPKGAGIGQKHVGLTVADLSDAALQYYAAGGFTPSDGAGRRLQGKCLEEVKVRTNAA